MTKKQKQTAQQLAEQMGGEWIAPVVAAHYLSIGEQAAKTITTQRISREVEKQREEERKAEAAGMVCLMSAEFVGEILKGCQVLANADSVARVLFIKYYL